ncbi:MAG: tetratricopeptide repeat protein [Pseudomonadota bacterium]|nr:tetratricopeptide repeat protein [Pseudomonadota bacterium]
MKTPALLAFTAISLAACATNQPAAMVEQGYQRGALAVAAIDRGDWSTAEEKLIAMQGTSARDPARLINLGTVYMETGRPGAAMSAWRLALASPKHFMIETRDGRTVSTEVLARQAIARHSGDPQVSAR